VSLAAELERIDDEMDGLHRALFAAMLAENWRGTVEETIDVTLLSRYYERFGDHATSIARRVVFLVTGHTEIGRSTGGTPAGVRA
jgi:phosphate transport system protein